MFAAAAASLAAINGSKLTWGIAAIVASLGSRFIIGDLTMAQQTVLRHPMFKRAALFCMLFLPTRDILLSVCLTVVASILLEHLMNEQSGWCLLPERIRSPQAQAAQAGLAPMLPADPLPIASRAPLMGPTAAFRPKKRKAVKKPEPAPAHEVERFSPTIGDAVDATNTRSWY